MPKRTKLLDTLYIHQIAQGDSSSLKRAIELLSGLNEKFSPGTKKITIVEKKVDYGSIHKRNVTKKVEMVDTLLTFTLKHKQLELVKYLLKNKASISETDENGNSPLHIAISLGLDDITDLLIEQGANVNAKNNKGETPLHLALARRDTKRAVIDKLIAKKADLKAVSNNGTTLLHIAVRQNYDEFFLKLLMDKGVKVNAKTKNKKMTALHIAARKGNASKVLYLLDHGADPNALTKKLSTPLHKAIAGGDLNTVKILVENKANVNAKNEDRLLIHKYVYKPIYYRDGREVPDAEHKRHLEQASQLRKENAAGRTPLEIAFAKRDLPMMNTLVKGGAKVESLNSPFSTKHLSLAKENKFKQSNSNVSIPVQHVNWLLDHNVQFEPHEIDDILVGFTGNRDYSGLEAMLKKGIKLIPQQLIKASEINDLSMLKWLNEQGGITFNGLDSREIFKIYENAIKNGNIPMLDYLITRRLPVPDHGLITAAAAAGNLEIAKWLVSKGMKVEPEITTKPRAFPQLFKLQYDSFSYQNYTALHQAAARGDIPMIEYLLQQGATLEGATENNTTVLHLAAKNRQLDAVKVLFERFTEMANKRGEIPPKVLEYKALDNTPLLAAAAAGQDDIVKYFIEQGADLKARNDKGKTVLQLYIEKPSNAKNTAMISYLISQSKDQEILNLLDNEAHSPLYLALKNDNESAARLLLKGGAVIDATAESFSNTLKTRTSELVQRAIKIALMAMNKLSYDELRTEECLLDLQLGLNLRTSTYGNTALHHAIQNGNDNLTAKILSSALAHEAGGVSVINVQNKKGQSPLHVTILKGNVMITNQLLLSLADPKVQDEEGNTPLHLATNLQNRELVTLLLSHNFETNLPNLSTEKTIGMTAFALAASKAKSEPDKDGPYIYSLFLCNRLKNLQLPDRINRKAIEAFEKEKRKLIDSLEEQLKLMQVHQRLGDRQEILLRMAQTLSDKKNDCFDPVYAYKIFNKITKGSEKESLERYEKAHSEVVSLLLEGHLHFKPSKLHEGGVIAKRSYPLGVKVVTLDLDEESEKKISDESEEEISEEDKKIQSTLLNKILMKHFIRAGKEMQELVPFGRLFASYALGREVDIPSVRTVEEEGITSLLSKVKGLTAPSMDAIAELLRQEHTKNKERETRVSELEAELAGSERQRETERRRAEKRQQESRAEIEWLRDEVKRLREQAKGKIVAAPVTTAPTVAAPPRVAVPPVKETLPEPPGPETVSASALLRQYKGGRVKAKTMQESYLQIDREDSGKKPKSKT